MKRVILIVVGVVVVLVALASATGGGAAKADPEAATKLAANIAERCQGSAPDDWCTALEADPVDVQGTVAFIRFAARMDGAPIAPAACRTIAALTNDAATAKPLGITSVVISANGKNVAQCSPPG